MKEIMKYVANDGTEFVSKENCVTYEQAIKINAEENFKSLPQYSIRWWDSDFGMFGGEDKIYAVDIRTSDDLKALNEWLKIYGDPMRVKSYGITAIGTTQMFALAKDDGMFTALGTPEHWKKFYSDAIDLFVSRMKGENE